MFSQFLCERHAIDSFASLMKLRHSRKNSLMFYQGKIIRHQIGSDVTESVIAQQD
jgi:hypothetical protein